MAKSKNYSQMEDFVKWMAAQTADKYQEHFGLDVWGYGDDKSYYLITGSQSDWYGHSRYRIPNEIGRHLAAGWKTNQYQNYVGRRKASTVLNQLPADVRQRIAKANQIAKEAAARRRIDHARERVTESLAVIAKYRKEAGYSPEDLLEALRTFESE